MKKRMLIILAFITMFLGIVTVNAAGPEATGVISVKVDNTTTYLYSASQTIGTVDGLSYNSSTNTLTINNYSNIIDVTKIVISHMGDLKINVLGINNFITNSNNHTVDRNSIITISYTNVIMDGTGTLNLKGSGIYVTRDTDHDENNDVVIKNIKINGSYAAAMQNYVGDVAITIGGEGAIIFDGVTFGGEATIGVQGGSTDENDNIVLTTLKNSTFKSSSNICLGGYLVIDKSKVECNGLELFKGGYLSIINNSEVIHNQPETIIYNSQIKTLSELFLDSWVNIASIYILDDRWVPAEYNILNIDSSSLDIKSVIGITGATSANIYNSKINIDSNLGIYIPKINLNKTNLEINNAVVGIVTISQENDSLSITKGTTKIDLKDNITDFDKATISEPLFNGGMFPGQLLMLAMTPETVTDPINISDDLRIAQGGEIRKTCIEDMCFYYLSESEYTMNPETFELTGSPITKKLLIRDKNWKPEAINNTITNVPDTLNNKIAFIIVGTLVVVAGSILLVKMKDKKTK